jgi:hypothetical protein
MVYNLLWFGQQLSLNHFGFWFKSKLDLVAQAMHLDDIYH